MITGKTFPGELLFDLLQDKPENLMNHLIVYAHPNTKSLCHTLAQRIAASYRVQGGCIDVSDLYAISFNPILSDVDMAMTGWEPFGSDIRTEQNKIDRADTVTFIAPIWWGGLPAILKGYFDRVFRNGFAYDNTNGKTQGLLTNKKFLFILTTQEKESYLRTNGSLEAITRLIKNGISEACGVTQSEIYFLCGTSELSDSQRRNILKEVEILARSFACEEEQHYYF